MLGKDGRATALSWSTPGLEGAGSGMWQSHTESRTVFSGAVGQAGCVVCYSAGTGSHRSLKVREEPSLPGFNSAQLTRAI